VSDAAGDMTLSSFSHRRDYDEVAGQDRWEVRVVNAWVRSTLPPLLSADSPAGVVIDVGCAEQPFRRLIESTGRRYLGMDVVQNSTRSVHMVSTLEDAPTPAEPCSLILCTEVLEHVVDIDAAFAGLRRLIVPGGAVVLTVPFMFPMHMEPYDFRRLTLDGVERLARAHGFRVEASTRLGSLPEVLATMVSDASILPTSRSLIAKAKVGALRIAVAALRRALESATWSKRIVVNSNCYLCNGVVLRAV
jgi:hypothetical protein